MKKNKTRVMISVAMLSAVSFVLMLLDFSLPIFPGFLKIDLSDIPALIGGFAFGPVAGVLICLIKNVLHLPFTSTAYVGELANFVICSSFVLTASLLYKRSKSKKGALIAMMASTIVMIVIGCFANFYFLFPFYSKLYNMPMQAIISMCSDIFPFINTLFKVIIFSVAPFNLLKGVITSLVTLMIYKKISPILHGN